MNSFESSTTRNIGGQYSPRSATDEYFATAPAIITRMLQNEFMLGSILKAWYNHVVEILVCFRNKRKKKARKNRTQGGGAVANSPWYSLSPSALWVQIQEEALEYYDFEFKVDGIDDIVEKFSVQKISLLRRFCIVMGVQVCSVENLYKNYTVVL